jgi:divalent metal cation (Fe/Co/Zn/Cd) transporter
MDENIFDDIVDLVKRKSMEVEGVLTTEKCFVRKIGMTYLVDLHAVVDANLTVKEGHDIAHRLKDYLMVKIPGISNVFVHVEPFSEYLEIGSSGKAKKL